MAVFQRLCTLFVVALAASSVAANAIQDRTVVDRGQNGGPKNCAKGEFSFGRGNKNCCLPTKPPSSPPSPPKDHPCPPKGYYWHSGNKFCAPVQPPDDDDEPECPSNCRWNKDDQYCQPTPPKPQPSHGYGGGHGGGNGNGHGGKYKRDLKSRAASLCPSGLTACPVSAIAGADVECLDTQAELESCGGCATIGQGQDCTIIEGAWNVGCETGSCAVYTCQPGYILALDRTSCIAL